MSNAPPGMGGPSLLDQEITDIQVMKRIAESQGWTEVSGECDDLLTVIRNY